MKLAAVISVVFCLGLLGWMLAVIGGVFVFGFAMGRLSDAGMGRLLRCVTGICVLVGIVIYFKPDLVEYVFKLWR